ncbi:MAG: MTH1187 family thiamine-binding protein [Myxococcota bacterium]
MAIAAVSISPVGSGVSVSRYVAAAIAVLEAQHRVRWQLDSMFTTLEGDPADLFAVIAAMQEAVFASGAVRVGTVIKMDERRDRPAVRMEDKVRAVEARLASRAASGGSGGPPEPSEEPTGKSSFK